ncbi:PAN/Apple domain-containing protein, partial [Oceanospirillum sediminis]|uniref:PAN/Apple domain-containing protein n=1 Tax=Oceanospirillum sediminis TaxID=2760088 RepID=UPI0034D1C325
MSKAACEGKVFPSIDIPGSDIENFPAASPEHCQALCSAHHSCTFFTYSSNGNKCYLKDNKNEMVMVAKQG